MSLFLREPDDPTNTYSFDIIPTREVPQVDPAKPWEVEIILRQDGTSLTVLRRYATKLLARLAADAYIKTWLDARL